MSSTGYATPRAVRKAALSMDEQHLHCRDYGHSWQPYSVAEEGRGFVRELICSCEAIRKDRLDRRGGVVSSGIDYPEGYLLKGLGRVTGETKGIIRLQSIMADMNGHMKAHTSRR